MKKNFSYLVRAVLLLLLCFSPLIAHATAIVWSEADINLDTLTFTTTGNLNVTFSDAVPTGVLVSRDEASYADIVIGPSYVEHCPGCIYLIPFDGTTASYTKVEQTWNLASTGSGNLTIALNFHWDLNALPGYMPVGDAAGPDNVFISVYVNNLLTNYYQLNPNFPSTIDSSVWSLPSRYFAEGQINTLTIAAATLVTAGWIDKPCNPGTDPVPEPATLFLFGIGMAGMTAVGPRIRKQLLR